MTHVDTMFDFARKNGYDCRVKGNFLYITTTNDSFRIRMSELLSDAKDVWLFHGGDVEGWHKQGKHPWSIKNIQKAIYDHDGYLNVHRGRSVMIPPKRGDIQYGKSKYYKD